MWPRVKAPIPDCASSAFGFTPGNYNVFYLADSPRIFSEAALGLAQALSPFRIATLMLQGVSPFLNSPLQILNAILSDYDGTDSDGAGPDDGFVPVQTVNGSITVTDLTGPQPVPQPGTIALFGAGAAILAIRRLRRTRS